MFPGLRLKLSGLNPSLRYILLLDIVPADNSRYRFQGGGWQAVGGAEARLPDRVFIHPDSPATGAHWQSRTISFHYAKLTNNTLDTQGHVSTAHWLTQHKYLSRKTFTDRFLSLCYRHFESIFFYFQIILHSLHRYQPRVHVIEARDVLRWGGGQHSFVFPETQFITVTAYQNNKVHNTTFIYQQRGSWFCTKWEPFKIRKEFLNFYAQISQAAELRCPDHISWNNNKLYKRDSLQH